MKKLIRAILCCLVAINVFMLTAFAAVPSPEVYTSIDQKSNLCDVKQSIVLEGRNLMQEEGLFLTRQM